MFQKLKSRKNSADGFTIIEVLIVLAIAGLIMVVVFLAVPALQRSQRNNSRKTDANNLMSSISDVTSNNGGVFAASDLANALLDTKLGYYASSNVATSTVSAANSATADTTKVLVVPDATCGSTPTADITTRTRSTAVVYWVETGSGTTRQCVSS